MTTPLQRTEAAGIRARAVQARKTWRLHRKVCRLCAQLSKDRSQYCDDGWAIRLELHHAERALHNLQCDTEAGQDALF